MMRVNAAKKLRRYWDIRAVDALIGALNDDKSLVREHAAESLGQLKAENAVEPLIAQLRNCG
jgi:HEAT repeat protein